MQRGNADHSTEDGRRFGRYPVQGKVYYELQGGRIGTAACLDVGRGGLSVKLPDDVAPGTLIRFDVVAPGGPSPAPEFKGKVVWRRAAGAEGYEAGIRVYHDTPDAVAGLSGLLHAGLTQAGMMDRVYATLRNRNAAPAGAGLVTCRLAIFRRQ